MTCRSLGTCGVGDRRWIPAFAGMTGNTHGAVPGHSRESGNDYSARRCPEGHSRHSREGGNPWRSRSTPGGATDTSTARVLAVIPAKAGIHDVRGARQAGQRTRLPPASLPSFPRRRESMAFAEHARRGNGHVYRPRPCRHSREGGNPWRSRSTPGGATDTSTARVLAVIPAKAGIHTALTEHGCRSHCASGAGDDAPRRRPRCS